MTPPPPMKMDRELLSEFVAGNKSLTYRPLKPQPKNRPVQAETGLTIGLDPAKDAQWIDADCIKAGVDIQQIYKTLDVVPLAYPDGSPTGLRAIITSVGICQLKDVSDKEVWMLGFPLDIQGKPSKSIMKRLTKVLHRVHIKTWDIFYGGTDYEYSPDLWVWKYGIERI